LNRTSGVDNKLSLSGSVEANEQVEFAQVSGIVGNINFSGRKQRQ
jgi:hypothetical protein